MKSDPTSLDHLHDLVVPPPVPLWPPAPGWYVVIALVLVLLIVLLLRFLRHWRANAYRRAALAELGAVANDDPRTAPALAELLKRTALAAYPREEIAGLSGGAWLQWLESTGRLAASAPAREALVSDIYRPDATPDHTALRTFVVQWIRRHRAPAISDKQ